MSKRTFAVAATLIMVLSAHAWSAQQPIAAKPLSVNELAAKPDSFVGRVAVVGRVAATSPGKGFTLIDSANCANCTTECLTDKATKKIPFVWRGAAPVVRDVVRVEGILAKSSKGFTFTAEQVAKQ